MEADHSLKGKGPVGLKPGVSSDGFTLLLVVTAAACAVTTSFWLHDEVADLSNWLATYLGPTWWALVMFGSLLVAYLLLHLVGDIVAGAPGIERISAHLVSVALIGTFEGLAHAMAEMDGFLAGASHAMRTTIAAYCVVVVVDWLAGFRVGQQTTIAVAGERRQ